LETCLLAVVTILLLLTALFSGLYLEDQSEIAQLRNEVSSLRSGTAGHPPPPLGKPSFLIFNATAAYDDATRLWSVTLEGQFWGNQTVNVTEVYALTETPPHYNLTRNTVTWSGASPIGSTTPASPFPVNPGATLEIFVSLGFAEGFSHGQLVGLVAYDSAGDQASWSIFLP
jgi:hypothetical protein